MFAKQGATNYLSILYLCHVCHPNASLNFTAKLFPLPLIFKTWYYGENRASVNSIIKVTEVSIVQESC